MTAEGKTERQADTRGGERKTLQKPQRPDSSWRLPDDDKKARDAACRRRSARNERKFVEKSDVVYKRDVGMPENRGSRNKTARGVAHATER